MADVVQLTTLDQLQLSLPMRALNAVGKGFDSVNFTLVPLEADTLIAQASRRTGLTNWGDDEFLSDYRVLLSSFRQHQKLTLLGRLGMRTEFLRVLSNRLQIVDLTNQHPEILDIPIQRPIFILGLPRTGTTVLHKLFAQDTNMRVPPLWQLMTPLPLTDDERLIRRRIRRTEVTTRFAYFIVPLFRSIHQIDAREPEECVFLLPHHLVPHGRGNVPNYVRWYLQRDATPDYQYYKQQLQSLQWQQPSRTWVMKTPFHLFTLDALLNVFPDACIIQTHRDPAKVIPSWCSFEAAIGTMHQKQINPQQIGDDWLSLWKTALERTIAIRDSRPQTQFYDLHFEDFVDDPVACVRQIYKHFGLPFSDETGDRMQRWLDEQPHEKHGVHRYAAAQFGLSEEGIRAEYRQYMQRFEVQAEM
jgi:hypothetical protein